MKKVTAIVPMRAGSQRLKNKNVTVVGGKHLYAHIIESLLKSKHVDKIVVNTDISEIGKKYDEEDKIEVIVRRKDLRDNCDINLVIEDTLGNVEGEFFLQTHATNPLLSPKTIDEAAEVYFNKLSEYDSLFSVTRIKKRLWSHDWSPLNHDRRQAPTTQNLKPLFEENSCIYIFSRDSFMKNKNRIGKNPYLLEIPLSESIDIDTCEELKLVKKLIKK